MPVSAAARGTAAAQGATEKKSANTRCGAQLVCREPEQFTENELNHRVNWQAKKRS